MWSMPPLATEVANNAIAIFGPGRTGTSLVAQLIHSAKDVELAFEPPSLISLFSVAPNLPDDIFRTLTTTFIFEELVVGSLAGRFINMNRADDSSIYKALDLSEVQFRTDFSHRKAEVLEKAAKAIPAFKIAQIPVNFSTALEAYPTWKRVAVLRDPVSTAESLLAKKWFSELGPSDVIDWPYQRSLKGFQPFWMNSEDVELWPQMTEIERAETFLLRQLELVRQIEGVLLLSYDFLVQSPEYYVSKVFSQLELEFTAKTEELIAGVVTRNPKNRDVGNPRLRELWLQTSQELFR